MTKNTTVSQMSQKKINIAFKLLVYTAPQNTSQYKHNSFLAMTKPYAH